MLITNKQRNDQQFRELKEQQLKDELISKNIIAIEYERSNDMTDTDAQELNLSLLVLNDLDTNAPRVDQLQFW